MKLRARRRMWWSIAVAVIAVGVVGVYALGAGPAPAASAPATSTVQRGTVTLAVAAAGTVGSTQTRGLSFSMAGTVTELSVQAGDSVKAGTVLARIDASDAQDAVDSAQSRLSDAQDAADRAAEAANTPACPTATAKAPSAGPSATSTPAAPRASSTCSSGRTSTNDSLLSAQQQLNNAELALIRAKARLAGTVIKAPIAGRILSVGGKVGSKVAPGGTGFIVLGDVANLAITAQFSEADVGRLAVGQKAEIALPNRDTPYPGSVSQIDPAGTLSNRLVRYGVVIVFDSVPSDLLLGQSATVTVTTAAADGVLYVASAAVTDVQDGSGTVTVRTPAGGAESRTVKVGLRGDQYTEIVSGLAEGDVVVLPTVNS